MRKTIAMAATMALALAASVGCAKMRKEADRRVGRADETARATWDTMDRVMRYQVSRVDMKAGELVLVPVALAEEEIEPQAGQELRLTFEEFRTLTGKTDPSMGDVIQSIEEGGEVIIYGKHLGPPNHADDIEKIELPQPE